MIQTYVFFELKIIVPNEERTLLKLLLRSLKIRSDSYDRIFIYQFYDFFDIPVYFQTLFIKRCYG